MEFTALIRTIITDHFEGRDVDVTRNNFDTVAERDTVVISSSLPIPRDYVELHIPQTWEATFNIDVYTSGEGAGYTGEKIISEIRDIMIANGVRPMGINELPHLLGGSISRWNGVFRARYTPDNMTF